jgi:hypothetical protein
MAVRGGMKPNRNIEAQRDPTFNRNGFCQSLLRKPQAVEVRHNMTKNERPRFQRGLFLF